MKWERIDITSLLVKYNDKIWVIGSISFETEKVTLHRNGETVVTNVQDIETYHVEVEPPK